MGKALKLLVLEDSENDFLLLLSALEKGGLVPAAMRVDSEQTLKDALREEGLWDMVISDYALPGFSGLDALRTIREFDPDLPSIMVSGTRGEEFAVQAMRAGAGDYVTKNNMERLVPAIRRELEAREERRAHRQADEALRRSEAEIEATINAIVDAVLIHGPGGEIRRLNPAAQRMFGCSETQECPAVFKARTAEGAIIPPERLPGRRALQGETVRSEVIVFEPPGAQPLWTAASAAPITTVAGQIVGAVCTLTDITSLHELQKEREMYVHTISHDLRTPLTVVLGHAELLGLRGLPEGARPHVEAIVQGAKRMNRLIEDLVEAARLEGGEVRLKKEAVPVQQFLSDFLHRAAPAIDATRVDLRLPPDLPPLEADPDRLERILSNLLVNALRYSPPETRVEVGVKAKDGSLLFSVRDEGRGIHPEDQPHLFERFHRFRNGGEAGSVGLGLYITRALVEAHGGRIWARSAPGTGTTFSLLLPCARAHSDRER